jgi:predicted AlkP superfamily pyrophosphatase or phosphodiesterase
MIYRTMRNGWILLTLLLMVGVPAWAQTAKAKKVLIIGIDGVRADALKAAKAPNLRALAEGGAVSYEAQTGAITISGPSWSSMLTGVWMEKHGVRDNSFKGANYDEYPHFFRYVKQVNDKLRTASIAHWSPINYWILSAADYARTEGSDEAVAAEAARYLSAENPDVLFLHFDEVDGAGHGNGYHPSVAPYMAAIEKVDTRVGTVLTALRARKTFAQEEWLILVSTDHGGQGKGHGPNTPECRTIFFIANGDSVKQGSISPAPNIVDVAATALTHLGIALKPEWKIDGRPVGLKAVATTAP